MNTLLAIFSFCLFMMGLIMSVLTYDAQQKLGLKCVDHKVQVGLNLLLMLSVMMVMMPLMLLFCHWHCGCPQYDLPYIQMTIFILLSMGVTSLSVYTGLKKECAASNAKTFTLATAILTLLSVVVYMSYLVKHGMPATGTHHGGGATPAYSAGSSIEMTEYK